MRFKLVMMPPLGQAWASWPARVAQAVPEATVLAPASLEQAGLDIVDADACFGTIPPATLPLARRLRWLQAPAAAPPVGYSYRELVDHPVVVTYLRGIFSDSIAPHILAFLLAFARGFHLYLPRQFQRN